MTFLLRKTPCYPVICVYWSEEIAVLGRSGLIGELAFVTEASKITIKKTWHHKLPENCLN